MMVYIVLGFVHYKTITKKFANLEVFSVDFIFFLQKSKFFVTAFLNLCWGHVNYFTNVGPNRFRSFSFIGYKRIDRQAKYINI